MKQKTKQNLSVIGLLAIATALLFGPVPIAHAAQATSFSDVLSRLADGASANHEIKFVTPTGVQDTSDTITFLMTGFTSASVDAITATDVDFAVGDSNNCSTAGFTDQAVSGTTGSGATWGFDTNGSNLMTLDPDTATITAARCVRLRVGTNAVSTNGSGPGVGQIVNGTAATAHTITLGGVFGDSATLAIDVITNDQVSISATVDPTITFTIDDYIIGFGTLSSATGRWATADATGANASGTTPTAANVLTVATNAASGYVLSYNGATLTSSGGTIDVASVDEDSDGTPGVAEQFGISASTDDGGIIATGYARDAAADFTFVASTTTTLASKTSPTATETFSVSYLANITGATEAGAYSTTLTYIATGTF